MINPPRGLQQSRNSSDTGIGAFGAGPLGAGDAAVGNPGLGARNTNAISSPANLNTIDRPIPKTDETGAGGASAQSLPEGETENRVSVPGQVAGRAVDDVSAGAIEPGGDIDFSTLSVREIGSLAAEAATQIGRNAEGRGDPERLAQGQETLAGIRVQLIADGASAEELAAFDAAVRDVAAQRALSASGSPDYDQDILREGRSLLRSGDPSIFASTSARLAGVSAADEKLAIDAPDTPAGARPETANGIEIIETQGTAELGRDFDLDRYVVRPPGETEWATVASRTGAADFESRGWRATHAIADTDGYRLLWENTNGQLTEWQVSTAGEFESFRSIAPEYAADFRANDALGREIVETEGNAFLAKDFSQDRYVVRGPDDMEWTTVEFRTGLAEFSSRGWEATDAIADGDGYRILWENDQQGRFLEWRVAPTGQFESFVDVDSDEAAVFRAQDAGTAPPAFSGTAEARFDENSTGVAYVPQADSVVGGPATYSLSGTDASLFDIDSGSGEVRFRSPPDFETPGDSDGDNTYDITVMATDSAGNSTEQDVVIRIADVRETPVEGASTVYARADGTDDAAGTEDDPFSLQAAINAAGDNGIIIALNDAGAFQTPGAILREGQVLLGAGATDPVTGIMAPGSGGTVINGTSDAQGVIGLGSDTSETYGIEATGGVDADGDGEGDGIIANVAWTFLMSGQSNASGHAFNNQFPSDIDPASYANAFMWEDNRDGTGANEFQPLTLGTNDGIEFNGTRHPQANPDLPDAQHGAEMYFARGMQQQLGNDDFYLVKLAHGSAAIDLWQRGVRHDLRLAQETTEAAEAIAATGAAPFIGGLMWMQGETNGGRLQLEAEAAQTPTPDDDRTPSEPYDGALLSVLGSVADNLGLDPARLPVSIMELDLEYAAGVETALVNDDSTPVTRDNFWREIVDDQREVAATNEWWHTIPTGLDANGEDLTPEGSATSDNPIHHGTEDFRYIGGEMVTDLNPYRYFL